MDVREYKKRTRVKKKGVRVCKGDAEKKGDDKSPKLRVEKKGELDVREYKRRGRVKGCVREV